MADAVGRKRKRHGDDKQKSKKRAGIEEPTAPDTPISISSIGEAKVCPPVVVSAPGMHIDSDLPLRLYQKKTKSSKRARPSELALYSTKHRTVDITAREEKHASGGASTQRQYVALYDPETGRLEVMEAKKMVARGTVRANNEADDGTAEKDDAEQKTFKEQRVDLGQTFGTRKAKKAIAADALNAISGGASSAADGSPVKLDAAAKATLSQIEEATSGMATREELQSAIDRTKPVPPANLEADEIADVYDPNVFIGEDILQAVPVRDWHEAVQKSENLELASRFVATRIVRVGRQDKPLEKLRVLRYLYFLLLFFMHSRPGKAGKANRRIPPREKLAQHLSPAPQSVVENIRRKFSEGGEMSKFHQDLLMTHCCLLSAIVDNFETDPLDIRHDLRLDHTAVVPYFRELGAKVGQRKVSGQPKAQPYVKLALPLDFPRQSRGAPSKKKRR